jgi:hypothetical protein
MPSQIFLVTRAPEVSPISERQIQRMISVERDDSEWSVREVELRPATLVIARLGRNTVEGN